MSADVNSLLRFSASHACSQPRARFRLRVAPSRSHSVHAIRILPTEPPVYTDAGQPGRTARTTNAYNRNRITSVRWPRPTQKRKSQLTRRPDSQVIAHRSSCRVQSREASDGGGGASPLPAVGEERRSRRRRRSMSRSSAVGDGGAAAGIELRRSRGQRVVVLVVQFLRVTRGESRGRRVVGHGASSVHSAQFFIDVVHTLNSAAHG